MSYWLGKHAIGETPLRISSVHQCAVTPEPEGATFGWLVECRCGWQARVQRCSDFATVKNIAEGTAFNHLERHSLESVNKEVLWPSSSSPSETTNEQLSQSPEPLQVQPSAVQPELVQDIKQEKPPVVSSQEETKKVEVSPSLQPTGASPTLVETTQTTPSSSTDSPATSAADLQKLGINATPTPQGIEVKI